MVTAPDDWRARFMRLLWIGAAVMVGLSAGSFAAAQLTAGSALGWVFDEIHQNLSVAIDMALPTWFAGSLWVVLGLLAWLHSCADTSRRLSWRLMAFVAWYASVDEFLMLHERLSGPATRVQAALGLDLGGARWVILGAVVALVVTIAFWRLVMSWPSRARNLVVLGGAVFLLGAVGFEIVHNLIDAQNGFGSLGAVVANHIEEAMEKVGVILAIAGLLEFLPLAPLSDTDREIQTQGAIR